MKSSPIKLNSKSKSKIMASKSPSMAERQSRVLNLGNKSHVHTLGPKVSPNKQRKILSNFMANTVPQSQNGVVLRSGSPSSKLAPSDSSQQSQRLENTKSFHQLLSSQISSIPRSPQKSFFIQSPSHADMSRMSNMISPMKIVNDCSRMNIELGRKNVGVNELIPTQRIVSPAKIIIKPSVRQVELERKVKILQMRINQLYSEKNMIETQLNQSNIRLQCENNMLKEKLNHLSQKPFQQLKQCSSCKKIEQNHEQISQKLIKDLQKSQENEYHQSKEIHSLKQQLLETQQMLSQQINKSLSLMDELKNKELENQQFKVDINQLKEEKSKLQEDMKSMQEHFHEIEEQSKQLMNEIQTLRTQGSQVYVTKELMYDLQQNNQLLISAIHKLQSSLKQSQQRIQGLTQEKSQLQNKIMSIQQSHESWIQKDTYTLEQIEELTHKITEIQNELNEKDAQLQEKNNQIKNQEIRIQQLMNSHQHEGNNSTAGSFYQKKSCDPCSKCEELRKTVIRLNSHLNSK